MGQKRRTIIATIISIIVLILTALGINEYNMSIMHRLEATVKDTLSEIATQQQAGFNIEIEGEFSELDTISKALLLLDSNSTVSNYLTVMQSNNSFNTLYCIDKNGKGISSTGEQVDLSDLSELDRIIAGEQVITEPRLINESGGKELLLAVPIFDGQEIVGALIGQYPTSFFEQALHPAFEGAGYMLVVNSSGDVLFSQSNEHTLSTNNIFVTFDFAQFEDGLTERDVKLSIASGQSGHISYSVDIYDRLAEYRPLNYNNWSMLTAIPAEIIAEDSNIVVNDVFTFSIIISFGIFSLLFIFWRLQLRSQKTVERATYYDDLTGAPNIVKFKSYVLDMLTKNPKNNYCIIKMDIENFKSINKLYDYEAGNKLLSTIFKMSELVSFDHFMMARVGIDEFLIFGPAEQFEDFSSMREFYRELFKSRVSFIASHKVIFRYGRYFIEPGETDVNDIIDKVSLAHSFTRNSKVYLCDYDEKLKQKVLLTASITNKMEQALKNREFKVFLQPKFDVKSDTLYGAEALVRWYESNGNMIFPGDFVPIFEQNGFIVELDWYMLSRICELVKYLLSNDQKCIPISVNFSRNHLSNPDFVKQITSIVDSYGIPHKYIEIELMESTLLENEGALEHLIDSLHAADFTLSIDDFGSGYSSLGMLKDLFVDTIKMDRSFFTSENHVDRGNTVVKSMTEMIHALDMSIVAEGVETTEQVEFLRTIKCDYVQGYYYARPMPVEQFIDSYYGDLPEKPVL